MGGLLSASTVGVLGDAASDMASGRGDLAPAADKAKCWAGIASIGLQTLKRRAVSATVGIQECRDEPRMPVSSKRTAALLPAASAEELELQAAKLRHTIERRLRLAGVNAEGDDVPAVVAHYKKMLLHIEEQIEALSGVPEAPACDDQPAASDSEPPSSSSDGPVDEPLSTPRMVMPVRGLIAFEIEDDRKAGRPEADSPKKCGDSFSTVCSDSSAGSTGAAFTPSAGDASPF